MALREYWNLVLLIDALRREAIAMCPFASGRLRLINGLASLDGAPIPSGGLRLETIESSM